MISRVPVTSSSQYQTFSSKVATQRSQELNIANNQSLPANPQVKSTYGN